MVGMSPSLLTNTPMVRSGAHAGKSEKRSSSRTTRSNGMKEIQPDTESSLKLGANTLTATTLQCMGEVLALLQKGGVEGHLTFDVLTNSLFDSGVHKTYGAKIVEGRYSPPGLTAPLAIKDLRLALAEAEHEAVPMPAASLVHDRLVAMVARGWAGLDWSALGLLAAVDAGLDDRR